MASRPDSWSVCDSESNLQCLLQVSNSDIIQAIKKLPGGLMISWKDNVSGKKNKTKLCLSSPIRPEYNFQPSTRLNWIFFTKLFVGYISFHSFLLVADLRNSEWQDKNANNMFQWKENWIILLMASIYGQSIITLAFCCCLFCLKM